MLIEMESFYLWTFKHFATFLAIPLILFRLVCAWGGREGWELSTRRGGELHIYRCKLKVNSEQFGMKCDDHSARKLMFPWELYFLMLMLKLMLNVSGFWHQIQPLECVSVFINVCCMPKSLTKQQHLIVVVKWRSSVHLFFLILMSLF